MKHSIYQNLNRLVDSLKVLETRFPDTVRLIDNAEKLKRSYTERDFSSISAHIRKLTEGAIKLLLGDMSLEKQLNKLLSNLHRLRKEHFQDDHERDRLALVLSNYLESVASHSNPSAHESAKHYDESEIDVMLNILAFVFSAIIRWHSIPYSNPNLSQYAKYKSLGNLKTQMLPIFPYQKNYEILSHQISLKYDVSNFFHTSDYPDEYRKVADYIESKATAYNEAKPCLIDYDIKRSEEDDCFYIELSLAISGYHDFLTINRNLDYISNGALRKEIRASSLSELLTMNIPKSLGISCLFVTNDDFVVFQKRNKSEVASNMHHVSIAEGLTAYNSYAEFAQIKKNKRLRAIIDKSIESALFRGIEEEIGITSDEISDLEILSIYMDEELLQPIVQTTAYVNRSAREIEHNRLSAKGIDTACEINHFIFVKNQEDAILRHMKDIIDRGDVWSTHAIINIISYLEFICERSHLTEIVNSVFKEETHFSLGPQSFLESFREDLLENEQIS